jgi:hypothetical protein
MLFNLDDFNLDDFNLDDLNPTTPCCRPHVGRAE